MANLPWAIGGKTNRAAPNAVVAVFSVRGARKKPTTARCKEMEEVIRRGKRKFKNFENRNPWIFRDSARRCVYVSVDPELELQNSRRSKK